MLSRRILLMYISLNSGHHCASLSIEEGLRELEPEVEILNINSLNYTNPVLEKIITTTYTGIIKRTPEVWEYLYDNPKIVKSTQKLRDIIHKFNSGKLDVLLNEFQPQLVACTQAFPCGIVADYKKTSGLEIPLIGILTDYAPHSYWLYEQVDIYIVPSIQTKEKLVKNGIPPDKIRVLGIPIRPKFAKSHDKEEIMRKFGLDPSVPIILVMGGGQGFGPIEELMWSLNKLRHQIQIIVIAGMNKKLSLVLRKKISRWKKPILIMEYVDTIDEIMEIATLIITKPGGLTTAEALSKGLPMIIVNPIPGQEDHNAQFLLTQGVAVKANESEGAAALLEGLLDNPTKLLQMKIQAQRESKPTSAIDTAKVILELTEPRI